MRDQKDDEPSVPVGLMERNTLRCFRCSETGHKAVDCQKKRRNETNIRCFTCQGPHHQMFCKASGKNSTKAVVAKLSCSRDQDTANEMQQAIRRGKWCLQNSQMICCVFKMVRS